jgi:hypothetical protein
MSMRRAGWRTVVIVALWLAGCAAPAEPGPRRATGGPVAVDAPLADAAPADEPAPAVAPAPDPAPAPASPPDAAPAPDAAPPPPAKPAPAPNDPYACTTPADCVIDCPRVKGCCSLDACGCRHAIRRDRVAWFAAEYARTCQRTPNCPAVGCAHEPAMGAACRNGRCVAVDGPGGF